MRASTLLVALGLVGAASACDGGVRARTGAGGFTSSPGGNGGAPIGGNGGGSDGAPIGGNGGDGNGAPVGGNGGDRSPPLTACGIVQEIPVASSPLLLTSALYLTRAGEGFVVQAFRGSETPPSLWFAALAADGTKGAVTTAVPPSKAYGWGLAGKARAGDQMLMIASDEAGVPPDTHLTARALDAGGAEFGPARPLFAVTVTNQTGQAATEVSLDGRRSVFAIGSPTLGPPVVALIGADGALIGAALTIATTAKDFGWRNLQVVSTAHGGAVSVMDDLDGQRRWHLAELDAAGAVVFDAAFPLPEQLVGPVVPRLIRPTPRGFVAVFQAYVDGPTTLVEIERAGPASGGPELTRVSPLFSDSDVLGLAVLGADFLVERATLNIANLHIVRVGPGGPGPEVTLPLSSVESRPAWIPAEDGALFFVYRTSSGLSIVKVACPP